MIQSLKIICIIYAEMEVIMIEIVYREEDSSLEEVSVKLPKNIKQIGDTRGNTKVYFEEMVMEMIKERPRYGVLLGNVKRAGNCSYIFVNGAVMAVNAIGSRHVDFSEKIWTGIHEDINSYYENPQIVGWFVSENNKSISLDNVKRIHLDNFPGNDMICMLNDMCENQENIYKYSNGLMEEIRGHYIYFDKNVTFERYLTRSKALEEIFEENAAKENEDEINDVSSKDNVKTPKFNFKEVIPSYMVIALLLAIIVVMNNSNQINSIKTSLSDIAGNLVNTPVTKEESVEDIQAVMENVSTTSTEMTTTDEIITETTTEAITETTTEKQTEDSTQQTTQPVTTAKIEPVAEPVFYVVKQGETLSDISRSFYNNTTKIKDIMKANDIENADMIYEGQKIILP